MDAAYVALHLEQDRQHWWFRGRLAVLQAVLRRLCPEGCGHLLEFGCGSGNVLEALAEFGEAVGMERDDRMIAAAHRAGLDVRRGALPEDLVVPESWADVVLLLDVLEHLDDERAALVTARRALRTGGWLIVTVPAYGWLWSGHDVALGHLRRYRASNLRTLLATAGFRVERVTYFNTLLFAPLLVLRRWKRLRGHAGHDLDSPSPLMNRWLGSAFALERHWVPRARLPFGGSLLALARCPEPRGSRG